jgi:hypothetical protein
MSYIDNCRISQKHYSDNNFLTSNIPLFDYRLYLLHLNACIILKDSSCRDPHLFNKHFCYNSCTID